MRDENFDGIDDYNTQQLANNINKDFFAAFDRDEALQKLVKESEDVFDDGSLEDDMATFNLGYQAGTLDERERILMGIQKLEDQSHATRTPLYQETMFSKIRQIVNNLKQNIGDK